MLSLTKTLKEQSLAAKDVIQKDTAVIEKAAEIADKNTGKKIWFYNGVQSKPPFYQFMM